MKTILKVITLCLISISLSSCYKYVSDRIDFYLSQEHDPDLIGVWDMGQGPDGSIQYREYRDDGKVYRHDKYADGTFRIMTHSIEYWYTKDDKIYDMITKGKSMKPYENYLIYHFSEAKDSLYIFTSIGSIGGPWFRTTLPE